MKSVLFSVFAIALSAQAFAESKFPSPDGKTFAQVQTGKNNEIYVTLQTTAGKTLAQINLFSQDADHGRALDKAVWSADSRFFVFTTESSGGHSPWHFQTYYYAKVSETFRSFDDRSNLSVAASDVSIDANDVLHFQKYNFDTQVAEAATISLSRLENVRN